MKRWSVAVAASAFALAACTSRNGGSPSTGPGTPLGIASTPTGQPTASASGLGVLPGRIAFEQLRGVASGSDAPYAGTFIVNLDGTQEQRLPVPKGLVGVGDGPVVWSPDGSKLVMNPQRPGKVGGVVWPFRPVIVAPGQPGFTFVVPDDLPGFCSAWSPDGTTLLCVLGDDDPKTEGIYSIRADGTGLTRLTYTSRVKGVCSGGDGNAGLDYAPDGNRFVFARSLCGTGPDPWSDESTALYVENIDGTGLRRVTGYGQVRSHHGNQVRWSPDGREILFADEDGTLHTIHPDGSSMRAIQLQTSAPRTYAYGPAWSPDGQWIVFTLYLFPPYLDWTIDLYIAWPDGTHLTQVTHTASNGETLANWGTNP
jgi:hypothetical protein